MWAILTNTEEIPLAGRDLRLDLIDPLGKVITLPIEIEGNKVISTVRGKDFLRLGVYRLTLWENYGQNAQTAVDCCEAFRLVSTTCQEGGEDTEGLDTETIDLGTSDMTVSFKGDRGDSAYEIAVKNGFKGTEEEWLASLKGDPFTYEDFTPEQIKELQQPALEAAESANNAAAEANTAASKANTAAALAETKAQEAENAANTAAQTEASIKQAETSRASAEKIREGNEAVRIASETARDKAEQGRVSAEQGRVSAENSRVSAEQTRVSAETQRDTEFTRLKGEAETATNNANQAAENANEVSNNINDRIVDLESLSSQNRKDIDKLLLAQSDYAVAAWNDEELAPESIEFYGEKDFLKKYNFYLIDTTDNAGETTRPVGKLMRNNLLRFEDGSFAPTVGITEAMRAECDVELYLDEAHQQKYCDAGAFNAETFYNEHGMAKLYNAEGAEVRVLRPWETTETKYTIGIGRDDTVYLLDNVKGNSGKVWKGLFSKAMTWDGIDVSDYPLSPTAMSPSPVCTIGDKPRSFFYLYEGEKNCQSSSGQSNMCTMFQVGRTYPRVNDMNQVTNMQRARSMNADTSRSYPFSEGGFHALNTYVTAQEVLYGTKYLHKNTVFGSGISSNDSCNSEATWKQNGGVRYKLSGSGTWKYANWNTRGDIYYTADDHKRTHFSTMLNSEHPKEQCMESQMVASFASETGILPDVEFEFYGGTYWYENVPNASGLSEGGMNVRVYKRMSTTFNAYDSAGAEQSWDVEIILRMSLIGGMNLSGDVFAYWGGGLENVGTHAVDVNTSRIGNPVDLYFEPDQKKWHSETVVSKTDRGVFDFEQTYRKLNTATNLGNGYASKRHPYSNWKTEKGGSISTGECLYVYDDNYWGSVLNTRYRIGSRFRGYAIYGHCSARHVSANSAVSTSTRNFAGSAQVLIEGAAPLQAE